MRNRWLIGTIIVLAGCAAAVAVFPATVYVPMGFFHHEAFFHFKPTSYWIRALEQEGFLGHAPPEGDIGKTLSDGGAAAVPVLIELVQCRDEKVSWDAVLALCVMGPAAKAAGPALEKAILEGHADPNASRFLFAGRALAKVDPSAAGTTLSAVLRDKDDPRRRPWAMAALLELAPQGQGAVPTLTEILGDKSEPAIMRIQAANVLWRMQQPPELLLPVLSEMVADEKSPAGVQATEVLQEMGPAARPILPLLMRLLEKPSLRMSGPRWGPVHRCSIVKTIGLMEAEGAAAVPVLIDYLHESARYGLIRADIIAALGHMGPTAKAALPILLKELTAGQKAHVFVSANAFLFPSYVAVLPAVTWPFVLPEERPKPEKEAILVTLREAVLKIDPAAAKRAGIHKVEPDPGS
jgi:hypothetical protein